MKLAGVGRENAGFVKSGGLKVYYGSMAKCHHIISETGKNSDSGLAVLDCFFW